MVIDFVATARLDDIRMIELTVIAPDVVLLTCRSNYPRQSGSFEDSSFILFEVYTDIITSTLVKLAQCGKLNAIAKLKAVVKPDTEIILLVHGHLLFVLNLTFHSYIYFMKTKKQTLASALKAAKAKGKYMVAVWRLDEDGTLQLYRETHEFLTADIPIAIEMLTKLEIE